MISDISTEGTNWRYCVEVTNIAFDFAVSAMYVRHTFHSDSKDSVSNVLLSYTRTHTVFSC